MKGLCSGTSYVSNALEENQAEEVEMIDHRVLIELDQNLESV